jgi:hypothetical protein
MSLIERAIAVNCKEQSTMIPDREVFQGSVRILSLGARVSGVM